MQAIRSRLVEGGRIIVPAAFRKAMGLAKGDALILELHGEELRVRPARAALQRLRSRLRDHGPQPGEPLISEQLIAERRREAAGG